MVAGNLRLLLIVGVLLTLSLGCVCGCSGGTPTLTASEMQKLDPALQRLLQGETLAIDHYSTSERGDGTTLYSVIIRSDQPDALEKAEIPTPSVQEDVITARLTTDEIRRAAQLDAVRRIENPAQHGPTPQP